MSTSFFKEKVTKMSGFLTKLADDNANLLDKKEKVDKYATEEFKVKGVERIAAHIVKKENTKESSFEKIEKEITSSVNYLLNNGYSIDEVQHVVSNKYSENITKKYLSKNANYILKAYGILGNICLDANSLENNIKISDYVSKISSKNPVQIKFVISKDKIKFANIGYKIIDSIDEVKISSDEAKKIISKITNDEVYFKIANKNPIEAVKAAYRDYIENKRSVKTATKETTKPIEHYSTSINDRRANLETNNKNEILKLAVEKKNNNDNLNKIASAVVATIESGKKIVLGNEQFEDEKGFCYNFKKGFEKLTSEVFKVFRDKYNVKLSHIGIASSFLIKADKCANCTQNQNGICILSGIKQSSCKPVVKMANYNFNKAFEQYNMKLSDLPDTKEEIYELDAQKIFS